MLEGRCALITGAVGGLGRAIAEHLAELGCNLVVNALCSPEEGARAAEAIARASGREVLFEGADLRSPAEIEAMTARALARFGALDILVNNAVLRHFAPIEALTTEDWEAGLAVNLSAAFHLTRLALPAMRARGWGRIVNLASIYAARGAENRVGYVTTKTALLGFTRAVALETAGSGITCNALCPGTAPSPAILARIAEDAARRGVGLDEAERDYLAPRHPSGRFVEPGHVAAFVGFLCGPAGRDITGAALPIDGGWSAR